MLLFLKNHATYVFFYIHTTCSILHYLKGNREETTCSFTLFLHSEDISIESYTENHIYMMLLRTRLRTRREREKEYDRNCLLSHVIVNLASYLKSIEEQNVNFLILLSFSFMLLIFATYLQIYFYLLSYPVK